MDVIKLSKFEFEKIFELSQAISIGLEEINYKFDLSKGLKEKLEDLTAFANQLMRYIIKNDPLETNMDARKSDYNNISKNKSKPFEFL
ncbi:MAG: hypothetical protein HWN67_09915 [Candidatus Helarchaeota archaeon]|nr:hypothetical protein [Candidatus Helarchaeota archaeon]